MTKSGAKLLDFGLAKLQDTAATAPLQSLTGEGLLIGTFHYMAPQQVQGKEADARSDIFALGSLLFEMTTGRRAFMGGSQASLTAAILRDDPPPLTALRPTAPPAL